MIEEEFINSGIVESVKIDLSDPSIRGKYSKKLKIDKTLDNYVLIRAILGDIAGSQYEFPSKRPRDLNWETCELFTDRCEFTDDTVMSIATKVALNDDISFVKCYQEYDRLYPNVGYDMNFGMWIKDRDPKPYGSFGNGSAMRVSYVADKFNTQEDVIHWAIKSAECTHNNPEGIKGACSNSYV